MNDVLYVTSTNEKYIDGGVVYSEENAAIKQHIFYNGLKPGEFFWLNVLHRIDDTDKFLLASTRKIMFDEFKTIITKDIT